MNVNEMEFCYVPAGPFMMGEPAVETPLEHEYWMGKYPVTVEQWNAYAVTIGIAIRAAGKAMHPVTDVSWHDAMAYCAWATSQRTDGRIVDLPTEQEWEKAARGGLVLTDGTTNPMPSREYPWGKDWSAKCANVESSGTTRVDAHPDGASPYGCMDMAGNVWEWTASDYDTLSKVVRGGSWDYFSFGAYCSFRNRFRPDFRYLNVGFRVVLRSATATPSTDPLPSVTEHQQLGMSLRAYFVGQAIAGGFAFQYDDGAYLEFSSTTDYELAAKRWVLAADAAIAALKEPK